MNLATRVADRRPARISVVALALAAAAIAVGCGETGSGTEEELSSDMLTARSLGLAYLEENRLDEAEEQFLTLVELAPDEALGHANLGVVHLRRGEYRAAEEAIRRALEIRPDDPDIRLSLARLHQEEGRESEARRVLTGTLESNPDHVKSLYTLADSYGRSDPDSALERRSELMDRVVDLVPGNTVARLQRAELYLRSGAPDSAAAQLEALRQQVPELPEEGRSYFETALEAARDGRASDGIRPLLTFQNFFRVTPSFQSDVRELRGAGEVQAGTPVMTFSSALTAGAESGGPILESLRFRDAGGSAGLPDDPAPPDADPPGTALAAADVDDDGDQDLLTVRGASGSAGLLRNEVGRFTDVTDSLGLSTVPGASAATVADYDNDGHLDLLVGGSAGLRLLERGPEGGYTDVTEEAGLDAADEVRTVRFVDLDHDGDLDLFVGRNGPDRVYRNDGDGGFTELAGELGLAGPEDAVTSSLAFGDFDDDLRIDLAVAREGSGIALYRNLGQNRFEEIAAASGLPAAGDFSVVRSRDMDNDGFLDLLLVSPDDAPRLFLNEGDGTFSETDVGDAVRSALSGIRVRDATFLDLDNDGRVDLAVGGEPVSAETSGLVLLHNEGDGRLAPTPDLLPESPAAVTRLEAADYNEDGDLDLFFVDDRGRPGLLRNDGGDANHYFKLQLVGLRTGSGKNNHFGIGARVELRAGDLYQTRVVDRPTIHFGLGEHVKADVVRILWTNGVPQNLFFPGSDQEFVERQTLKGSCAFLYTWNGERYEFVKDVMWRSALGMPVGIMAGSGTGGRSYAPPGPSEEYVRIPGEALRPRDGRYRMQITEELWEAAYFDEVRLLAVDHPDSVDVFVDERFVPPAPASLDLEPATRIRPPVAAVDGEGRDLLPALRHRDDVYADRVEPGRYQGMTEPREMNLDLGDLSGADRIRLFLQGWVYPTDASINVALGQSDSLGTRPPVVEVPDGEGGWKTAVENLSFPAGKAKTVVADLTGAFPEGDYRVRLRTNLEIYWDRVFVATDDGSAPTRTTTLGPVSADLHARGFSRVFRKGGRHGPQWFDYDDVTTESPWPKMTGYFTRYGDVLPLLEGADDRYVIMDAGDEVTVEFDASAAPELPEGWSRDFLLYTVGWIKDADLNTATGQTVGPLPFHGMSEYPYGPEERYPDDSLHRRYLEEYNTRLVEPRPSPLRTGELPRPGDDPRSSPEDDGRPDGG